VGWISRCGRGGGPDAHPPGPPGLIAERLAVAGAAVTGIDVSTSSLTHARESAARRCLTIDYRRQDFREVADDAGFDLVLQSYGELGTLDAATLATVLATIRRALRPGGALVFDVTTPAAPAPDPGTGGRSPRADSGVRVSTCS
jgi:2-polyprenyl-3-methyl-5-hydroxy-6-metoxy-1,4-benzoquinol methylase